MTAIPSLLVAHPDPDFRRWAEATLSAAGWRVESAGDGPAAVEAVRAGDHALVLLDLQLVVLDGRAAATAIRGCGLGVASVPILALASGPAGDAGIDDQLPKPCTAAALIDAVEAWRPLHAHPSSRLAALLGSEELTRLVGRFRMQLAEALETLGSAPDVRHAHRLAGLAGMLGFSDVYAAWLALSEGDDSAVKPARQAVRKAIWLIDNRPLNEPGH